MTSCEDLDAKYSEVSSALSDLSSAISELEIPNISNLERQIQELRSDLDGVKRQARSAEIDAGSAKRIGEKALREAILLSGSVSALNLDFSKLGSNVRTLKSDTQSLFRRTGDLTVDISHIGDQAGSARKLAQRASKEISGLNGEVRKVGQLAGDASMTAKKATREVTSLGGKVAGIFSFLAGFATLAALAALQAQINDVRSTASEGRMTARQALEHSGKVEQALISFENYIKTQLRLTAEDLSLKINRARHEAIRRAEGLYDILKSELSKVESKIERIKTELLSRMREIFNYIDTKIKEFESRIEKLSELIRSVEASVKEYVNSKLKELESRIEKLSELIRSVEASVKEYVNSKLKELLVLIENIKKFIQSQIPAIIAGAAAIALAQLLAKLPNLIKQNTPNMTCRFNDVAAKEAAAAAKRSEQKLGLFQTFVQGTMWADMKTGFAGTFARLGDVIPGGGIAGKLLRIAKSQLWDKVMSSLTFLAVLHNAMFLSKSVVTTLGETLSIGLSIIGVKDEDDSPIDINKVLGVAANDFMARILGASRWTELKESLQAANRVYQAAANVVYTVRSIADSSLAVGQWTAEQIAKIGNGLKADGVVSWNAYGWMPEIVTPQTAILDRLNNLDEAASSLNSVVSEVKSIQDESAELANQVQEFHKELGKASKEKEDVASAWSDDSKSPDIDLSNLFGGDN